jgi:2-polyprenyl-3-methyl-5-hydroxy-6-metoxy-1,4-benzoquinol methylase
MAATTERERWKEQWAAFAADIDDEERMVRRWIAPMALEEVRGLDVLDAGCGSGIHTAILLRAGARRVLGIDYAAWEVARDRFGHLEGASFAFHDLCASPPPGEHDLVVNLGVLPHVSEPAVAVANMACALKPGGRLVIWATVREGNLGLRVFDRFKPAITVGGKPTKMVVAHAIAATVRPAQWMLQRKPEMADVLPYGRYLRELAKFPFGRTAQNFYDALNAPRRHMFSETDVTSWMQEAGLTCSVTMSADGKSRTWIGKGR